MISLQSTRSIDDLKRFDTFCKEFLEGERFGFCTEMKYDGIALSLHYMNGKLSTVVTRGNGVFGELIDKQRFESVVSNVPLNFANDYSCFSEHREVRGELIVSKSEFASKATGYQSLRNSIFATLRNDVKQDNVLKLSLIAYDVNKNLKYSDKRHLLQGLGFQCCQQYQENESFDEALREIEKWNDDVSLRSALDYEVDGMVIKVNVENSHRLGMTTHHPKSMIAFKWSTAEGERKQSVLRSIDWRADHSGNLRPIGVFDAVDFSGAKVSKASLYNWAFIRDNKIKVNDKVEIERVGNVIPKIIPQRQDGEVETPSHCTCPMQYPVVEKGVHLVCENPTCSDKVAYKAYRLASVLRIRGVGYEVCLKLARHNVFKNDHWNLLRLKKEDFIDLDGFGETSASNMVKAIADSVKNASFEDSIISLGIPGVGKDICSKIAHRYPSVSQMAQLSLEDWQKTNGIGAQTASVLVNYFNEHVIGLLQSVNLKTKGEQSEQFGSSLPLFGQVVCVTGKFDVSRKQMEKELREKGASVSSTMSKKTTMLVVGRDPTQKKIERARKLEIAIVDKSK